MIKKILKTKTDKLIGILFTPWILVGIMPFTPAYNKTIDSIDLVFIILWIQLGMLYIVSYQIVDFLKSKATNALKTNTFKFGIQTTISFTFFTLWLVQIIFYEKTNTYSSLVPSIVLLLCISEFIRLRTISKLMVSVELNKEAKFKDYLLTMLLISSLYGAWNIHQRLQAINETSVPNNGSQKP
ncbi:MAG: hypothetical protein N4A74_05155 [Carboxylicivirga sp.]|jgi:cation transport ATPase|nr:hypothetical protein [Carboxylicivirga sp.]